MCLQYHTCDFFLEWNKAVAWYFSCRGNFHMINSHKLMICACTFWELYEMVRNSNVIKWKHCASIFPLPFYSEKVGGCRRTRNGWMWRDAITTRPCGSCTATHRRLCVASHVSSLDPGHQSVRLSPSSLRLWLPLFSALSQSVCHTLLSSQRHHDF